MEELTAEKAALDAEAKHEEGADLDLGRHPRLSEFYRRKVEALERVLDGAHRAEAMDLIWSMIDRVELTPRNTGGGVGSVWHGDLAAMLSACGGASDKQKLPGAGRPPGSVLSLVAGTRNQRCLHQLRCRVPPVHLA